MIDKDAHEGFRELPEVIYNSQTERGIFSGRIRVADMAFEQMVLGSCFKIMYLPEDPTINSAQAYVEVFDGSEYWSTHLAALPPVLGFIAFMILNYLRFKRKRG